jgi:hypothetical protein
MTEVSPYWQGQPDEDREGRVFFFVNKKKQKNFCNLDHAGFNALGPN